MLISIFTVKSLRGQSTSPIISSSIYSQRVPVRKSAVLLHGEVQSGASSDVLRRADIPQLGKKYETNQFFHARVRTPGR